MAMSLDRSSRDGAKFGAKIGEGQSRVDEAQAGAYKAWDFPMIGMDGLAALVTGVGTSSCRSPRNHRPPGPSARRLHLPMESMREEDVSTE